MGPIRCTSIEYRWKITAITSKSLGRRGATNAKEQVVYRTSTAYCKSPFVGGRLQSCSINVGSLVKIFTPEKAKEYSKRKEISNSSVVLDHVSKPQGVPLTEFSLVKSKLTLINTDIEEHGISFVPEHRRISISFELMAR